MNRKIAFITYETPFAPGGGIAAVMAHLPVALQSVSRIPTYIISPFHINIPKTITSEPEMVNMATIKVPFDQQTYDVDILHLDQDIEWIFLKPLQKPPTGPVFFAGQRHPYNVAQVSNQIGSILLRDSLFFGKAVALALPVISPESHWTLLLQDWEASATCLALNRSHIRETFYSPYLTLHNSYDSGIQIKDFIKIGANPDNFPGDTVLQCSLPIVNNPVFTVSEQFALDLSTEILQSEIMIPHLVSDLSPRLLGVNNGIFTDLTVPDKVLSAAQRENYTPIRNWKIRNREFAFQALDGITPSDETPIWGDLERFARDDSPWFVMAGRDDSRQKGYELACDAIAQFLSMDWQARFLFFPIPGDEGLAGIQFIQKLANRFPESVLGFPFLMREGYFTVMQGANFGIMPSYYEPFGMANEFYLKGVACIGRATGGIIQQIIPYRDVPSFTPSVRKRVDRWHNSTTPPTGLLFRERDEIPSALDDWKAINAAEYQFSGGNSDRLEQRKELAIFQSMVNELRSCLEDGTNLYLTQPNMYYKMLSDGITYITSNFSWINTARSYNKNIKE